MKKGVVFFLILWSFQVFSQTVLLSENFDGGGPYAFSSSGSPSWTLNSRLKVSGTYSDTCTIGLSSVSNLTSNSFSTVGYSYVILQFNHICKIENSDKAEIQYSIDNGNTWYALTSAQYLGSGNFTGNKFTEVSYTDWQPGIGGAIPTNSWWKQETFDLSSLVANQSNVKIRFRLSDGNANGANLRTGWYLDDIKIMASASELTPPTITQVTPIWQDTVFQVGPFPVKARINDASGISVAKLYFSINNSSFDSLLMVNTSLDTFVATIPSQPYNTRIDYYIKAWDASPAQNMAQSSAKWFYIKQAPPVVIIGNASTTTYYMPVNGYFKWGWSALLYTASEINKSGIIDSIFFRVSSNTSNFLMENQRMMIGVVPYSSFSDGSMPDSASLTTFYYGNVTWVGPGWFKITPITPFYYNGNSNLLIYWINRRGQYQTGYPVFYATNTSSYRAKYRYSDTYSSVFPTSTGTLTYTRPDIKIVFRLPSTLDLALSSITSPSPSAILEVGTSYDIKVQIKNEGTQTVTSCNLFYSIDNGAPSSYAWSGSLLQGGVSPEITIGSVVFTQPGTHKLKVWVSNPNGQPDQLNLNDTLTINYFVCPFILSGEYTINPLQPTGGTNFGSFRDALNTLRQCGISDTVVMRISPGTYDTILNINYQIPGAGVVGMVIFEGGGSVPSSVVLRNANTSSVNYVVNLQGTKGVGLRNLKLKSNGTSYGRCLVVEGGSRDILVEGCELEGLVVSSTSTDYAVVYSSSSNNEHNVRLVGNKIRNGSYGIYWYGYSSTLLDSGVVMKGNDIRDFYYSGMYVYYQRGLLCEGNYVKTGTSYSSPYGIYGGYCDYSVFSRNRVVIPSYYGMYLYYCDGDASVRGRVENNFVVVGGTGTAYGIYMYYSTFYNVYHNSVRIGSTSATSGRALYHYYSNNVDYKNNIWANMGGGYSVYVSGGTFESNYNDLYTTGSVLGYYTSNQNNLAAWQSATGKDGNSISAHPEYFSLENLHTINPVLNNIGTPVGVLFDIDNEPRSLSNPDIGADEFTPLPYELQIVDITSPVTGCGLGVEPVVVRIKNNGTDTLPLNNMATITYRLNQNSPVTENLNIIIPPGQIRVFTFTTPVNLAATVNDTSFVLQVYVTEPSDIIRFNDTLKTNILSLIVPPSPLVNPVTIPYGTSTVVSATGTSNIYWFADPLLTQLLGQGNAYTTPVLYDTTYYYVVNSSEIRYRYTFDNNLQGWQSLTPCTYTTYSWQWNSAGGIGVAFAQDPSTNSSQLLLSPVMNVGGDTLLFYMRHKYNTESCCDKAYIAYRINGGAWQRLVPYQGTYTGSGSIAVDPIANCSSTSGGFFSGNSQNYINTYGKIPLNLTQATLQIGLIFYSDGSIAGDGWYVDEVEIKKPGCHSQPSVQVVYTSGTPLYDLTCLEIISPNSGIELSSQEQVKIKIKNFGTQPVSNFQVGYRINNTSPVFETYSATLNHGSESVYTFNQTANLSAFQTYQIKAFVSYSGDNVQVNDTASKSVTNSPLTYCTASATSPGYEDLTGITIGSVTYNNPAIGATYQNYDTLPPFILFNGFSYPISVRSGFPPGYSTQYSCWVNVFIDYNRDGDFEDAGELVFSSATQSQNTVSGTLVVPPQTYMGTTKLRVVLRESGNASNTGPCGTFTWGEVEDYRVLLMPKIPQDAGVVQIISPSPVEISQNQIPLKVKVKNFGTDTLFAIPVSYKLNNQNPVTFTISDVLPPDTTRQYTIGNIVPNYGTNQLCAYTVVVGDSNTFNDKTCMNLYGLPNIIFFADTNDNNSLLTTSGTLWQYGQPSGTVINHAAVGQKCWVTNLTGNYPNNAESYLDLPLMNFLGIDTPHIVFYYWIHAEENYDGGFVQYSLDGVTWNSLGAINDAMGYNWFNSYITGTPGWSKNTNGWKLAYYRAAELSNKPYVKLRIGFKSNASNNFEGMAVDYFRILTPKANQDAGVVEIISPTDSTLSGSQVEVKVKIKNFGKNVLNSVSVRYKVSTGYPLQSTTWTGTLLPDHIAEVTFPNTYPGPSTSIPSYKLCAYTVVSNDPYKFNDTTCIMLQTYTNQGLSDDLYSMLKIYPNPVQNNVFIECPHELRVHSLVIYNMLGEKVDHVDWAFQDKFLLKVSLPVLPTGNYFIKLTTDKGIVKIPITVIQ